jgi:hypothetical protein
MKGKRCRRQITGSSTPQTGVAKALRDLFTVIPLNSQRREGGKVKTLIVPGPEHHIDKAVIIANRRDYTAGPDGIEHPGQTF